MDKQKILDFFKTREHAVISTCGNNGQPEAALIGFGETPDFEIIFGTFNTSKKYKNIHENPKVAFVVGWENDFITVQYEGIARELESSEVDKYYDIYSKKVPSSAHYRSFPEQRYFLVKPMWIRYSDLSEGDDISEFSF